MSSRSVQGFLGHWLLIPESCNYEQGESPRSGTYTISERDGRIAFRIDWTDAEGASHRVEVDGVPDGIAVPFAGGDLADAMSITLVSDRDLRSSAYFRGTECMTAQRQLDETGMAMRVTQVVRFRDGSHLANTAVYRKAPLTARAG